MTEQVKKDRGILKEGEICSAQGPYFSCTFRNDICPYIRDGINRQNSCPYNKLVEVKKD